ncbi:MAG: hypothetical protein IT497_02045, partial [Ottowia sp.]|nr:hypothetical protein [Ottowia sp.]
MSLQPFFSRLFMLLSALLVAFATWVYLPITLSKSSVEVMIAPNTSAWGIAHALTNNGVTQQTELFYLSVRVLQLCAYKLKAGTYLIDSGMSPQQI